MKNILFVFILFFVVSCANRVTPSGGPRDTMPPVVRSCSPPDSSLRFSSREIRITFDELVALNDLKGQLLVSPVMISPPEVRAVKKQLIISLPDTLQSNTTYTIRFGKSIVDVHEGNPLEDYQYVFSTGDYLDSLVLAGNVVDAATSRSLKAMSVMVYRDMASAGDSLPYNSVPAYFSRTNDKGGFRIGNMASGRYRIYALEDKNGNYRYDESDGEGLAFLSDPVDLPYHLPLKLDWSVPEPEKLRVRRIGRQDRFCAIVVFNKVARDVGVIDFSGNSIDGGTLRWSVQRDTLWLYGVGGKDSVNVILTTGGQPLDTVRVSLRPSQETAVAPAVFQLSVCSSPAMTGVGAPLLLSSFHTLASCCDSVLLKEDDSKPLWLRPIATDAFQIRLDYPWKPGSRYEVFFPAGLAKDRFQRGSDSLRLQFRVPDTETTASISLKLTGLNPGANYLLHYLNERDEMIRTYSLSGDTVINTAWLPPGKIRLRLIWDDDGNGRHTPGHIGKMRQPEKVLEYPEQVILRANWELEVIFATGEAKGR